MSLSMYQLSIPAFIHSLKNLTTILEKGMAHADLKRIAPEVLLNSRLFPDMLPLLKQVLIVSDLTTRGSARLAQADVPTFDDDEASFADLYERISKSIAFIRDFTPEQINGSEELTIEFKAGGQAQSMPGSTYLSYFILPNVYFHSATTYNILRHCGVELSKFDFLGRPE